MYSTNKVLAKIGALAKIVRDEGSISFEDLCVKGNLAPSTLYHYKPILLSKCLDIRLEGRVFKCDREPRVDVSIVQPEQASSGNPGGPQ